MRLNFIHLFSNKTLLREKEYLTASGNICIKTYVTRNNRKALDTKRKNDVGHRIDSRCNERIKVCPLFVIWKLFIRIRLIYFFPPLVDLSPTIQEGNSSSEAIKVKPREIDVARMLDRKVERYTRQNLNNRN